MVTVRLPATLWSQIVARAVSDDRSATRELAAAVRRDLERRPAPVAVHGNGMIRLPSEGEGVG
jgi:hypothetical protein